MLYKNLFSNHPEPSCPQTKTWRCWASTRAAYGWIETTPEMAAFMAHNLRISLGGPLPRQCHAMLKQKASWITGWQKRWVDTSCGISSVASVWTHRATSVPVDTSALMRFGADNRCLAMCRIVAYWLLSMEKPYPKVAGIFFKDKHPSICDAMDFHPRKQTAHA